MFQQILLFPFLSYRTFSMDLLSVKKKASLQISFFSTLSGDPDNHTWIVDFSTS